MQDYWSEHTRRLPTLAVGDYVWIQNQTGQHPNKWDRTGTVVEVKQHDQYQVKVDGSGRVTLRNRRILLKFTPITSPEPPRSIDIDFGTSFASIPPPPRTIPPPPRTIPSMLPLPPDLGPTTPAGPTLTPDVTHSSPSHGSSSPVIPTVVTTRSYHPTLDIAIQRRQIMPNSRPPAWRIIPPTSPLPPKAPP